MERAKELIGFSCKAKYFHGAEDFFRDLGRSMHYFRGRGSTDPLGASALPLHAVK